MPLEVALFRIDAGLTRLDGGGISAEQRLEEILEKDISIASADWFVIGRQVPTTTGGRADLICLDRAGDVVVIELKRNRTPREVVAQLLEYGWWARTLSPPDLASMYQSYASRCLPGNDGGSLDQAFLQRFGIDLPVDWMPNHQLVLVSAELDLTTERIIGYLSEEYEAAINALFFRVFVDEDRQYLARAWLRQPEGGISDEALPHRSRPSVPHHRVEWNGEYCANFGHDLGRRWEDALKYSYIAAGGGRWYVQTLRLLQPGDRVWVNIPGTGYVAVGDVLDAAVPYTQFKVLDNQGISIPITDAKLLGPIPASHKDCDEEGVEHFVRMIWIKAVPLEDAVREKGFFGNQNTVTRPRDAKWIFTTDRLKQLWGITD